MTNYSNRRQTPRFGKINNQYLDKGDFVFRLARTAPASVASPPVQPKMPSDPSIAIWNAIKDSEKRSDFETFLKTYPASPMAPFAESRLEALQTTKTAAVTPPPKPQVELVPVEAAYVTTRNANVRAEPSVSADKVTTLPTGTEVYVPGRTKDGNWLLVERDGKNIGYVYAKLLQSKLAFEISKRNIKNEQSLAAERKKHELEIARKKAEAERIRKVEELVGEPNRKIARTEKFSSSSIERIDRSLIGRWKKGYLVISISK